MPTQYPAAAPTISGANLTMEIFLQSPARVQRAIQDLTLNRFISDHIFAAGPTATGGAVLFDQLLAGDFFTLRDVEAIEPGSEFPIVNGADILPSVTSVTKWGGAAQFTYEKVRRDNRDVLGRELTRLRNTIIRKVDTVGIATLQAAVTAALIPTGAASASWATTSTDIISDIATAQSTINNADMGYMVDTVLLNPAQALGIRKNTGIRAALPRENMARNLIASTEYSGLLGIPDWYVSNRVTAGEVWIMQSKIVGGISDELPLYSRTIDQQETERYLVQAARVTVPYITDPKAAFKITGA